jgi:hypothetical protein
MNGGSKDLSVNVSRHILLADLQALSEIQEGNSSIKLNAHAQQKEAFRLLVLFRKNRKEDRKHSALRLEKR